MGDDRGPANLAQPTAKTGGLGDIAEKLGIEHGQRAARLEEAAARMRVVAGHADIIQGQRGAAHDDTGPKVALAAHDGQVRQVDDDAAADAVDAEDPLLVHAADRQPVWRAIYR